MAELQTDPCSPGSAVRYRFDSTCLSWSRLFSQSAILLWYLWRVARGVDDPPGSFS
jgi:hypothetical protein